MRLWKHGLILFKRILARENHISFYEERSDRMITYFVIGIIVQLVIIAERAIRFPVLWSNENLKHWIFWVSFIVSCCVNVLSWPLAIICEIYAVIKSF